MEETASAINRQGSSGGGDSSSSSSSSRSHHHNNNHHPSTASVGSTTSTGSLAGHLGSSKTTTFPSSSSSGSGGARGVSNAKLIRNALSHVCLAGVIMEAQVGMYAWMYVCMDGWINGYTYLHRSFDLSLTTPVSYIPTYTHSAKGP